jgi:type IV pilus assembly protein PilW
MSRSYRSRGFSLVELMVAMALGLVIVGGVVSVMLANKRSYRTNEGLSQIQESARTAYELVARDVRQSGTTGCDNARRMGNLLVNASTVWWQAWEGIHGYDDTETDSAVTTGTANYNRISGTDSIRMRGIAGQGFPVQVHDATAGTIQLNNTTTTSLSATDALIICDFDHSAMFRASAWDGATGTISYSGTNNCSTGLGFPTNCDGAAGLVYTFQRNAWVGRLGAVDYYIGRNPRGGNSLFRLRLQANGVISNPAEEVVAGVSDMQIQYGVNGSDTIASAASIAAADWANVNSVFITVTVDSSDTNVTTDAATNSGRIRRTFTYVITLRNRVA